LRLGVFGALHSIVQPGEVLRFYAIAGIVVLLPALPHLVGPGPESADHPPRIPLKGEVSIYLRMFSGQTDELRV
jgi:hypothetical protein